MAFKYKEIVTKKIEEMTDGERRFLAGIYWGWYKNLVGRAEQCRRFSKNWMLSHSYTEEARGFEESAEATLADILELVPDFQPPEDGPG